MKILLIYLIGTAITFTGIFCIEFFYFYDKKIRFISLKEILENIAISLLSWIGVALLVFWLVTECISGFNSKGEAYRFRKLEADMKEEYQRNKKKL